MVIIRQMLKKEQKIDKCMKYKIHIFLFVAHLHRFAKTKRVIQRYVKKAIDNFPSNDIVACRESSFDENINSR